MGIWQVDLERCSELMDDPALSAAEHFAALDALGTINAVSLTARHFARSVLGLVVRPAVGSRPLRIVDVACGGGDTAIALAARLARRLGRDLGDGGGPVVEILGIDSSPRAVERAARLAAARAAPRTVVEFAVRDVLVEGCPPCDVAISSLFLHHLDDGPAASVLRAMAAAAALGGVVSDLVRSRTGLVLAILGTRLLARSRVARLDGPLSVRAARTPAEYRRLADAAGLPHAAVRRTWPERVVLEWKTAAAIDELVAGMACA